MSGRPLSYESLKSVLQNMDANLRIQLSHRCPSIRCAEKVTPLKLDHLAFFGNRVIINETYYDLGIIRVYPHGVEVPSHFQTWNEYGGISHCDFDENGMEDYSWETTLTPGDINFFEGRQTDNTSRPLRKRKKPVYEFYFQFRIDSDRKKTIERFNYNKKHFEALKYLYKVFFGGRRHAITIKHFRVNAEQIILRFPIDIKLKIRHLQFTNSFEKRFNALRPILDDSILNTLDIEYLPGLDMNHPAIKGVNALVMCNNTNEPFLPVLMEINNREFFMRNVLKNFTMEDMMVFIKKCTETERSVNSIVGFIFNEEKDVMNLIKNIKKRFKGTIKTIQGNQERSITLPNNDSLRFSIISTPRHFGPLPSWIFKIIVKSTQC